MKKAAFNNLSQDQLKAEEIRIRDEITSLTLKSQAGQQKNVRAIRLLKKDLARVLTFLSQLKAKNDN